MSGFGPLVIGGDGVGTGDVVGPASATDRAVVTYSGTTGKIVQNNTGVTIDASNNLTAARGIFTSGTAGTVGVTGTGNTTGAGGSFTGGTTGAGVIGVGGATSGAGVTGTGTAGNSEGGTFTGQGSANGVSGIGGATGVGVLGTGGGAGITGVSGVGGATSGIGVLGTGTGSGAGVRGVGGATGAGVIGVGGATSGSGGTFTGTAGNAQGLTATGQGAGLGATITGGSSATIALQGNGAAAGSIGIQGNGGGSGSGKGVQGNASGTGYGVQGNGGNAAGPGVEGISTSATGWGVVATNASGGYAFKITPDTTSPVRAAVTWAPQDAQPTGAHVVGDMYVASAGRLDECTVAGTPGTFTAVGDQTTPVPATLTTAGTGITLDFSLGPNKVFDVQGSSGNVTLTMTNPVSGQTYKIKGIQGSSARTLTWSPTVKWAAGVAPTFTVTDNAEDFFTLWYDGANYIGTFIQAVA